MFEQIEQAVDAEADSEAWARADKYYSIMDNVNFNRSGIAGEAHVINKCLDFCRKQLDAMEIPSHQTESYIRQFLGNYSEKARHSTEAQAMIYARNTLEVLNRYMKFEDGN